MSNFHDQFPQYGNGGPNQGSSNTQGNFTGVMAKTFMANVFAWMFGALLLSSLAAYLFGTVDGLMDLLIDNTSVRGTGLTVLGWIVMIGPLGLVLLMSFGFQRLSFPVLAGVFILYAALVGMSLSFIFQIFTLGSIFSTFAITGGMFGVMAVLGYTTNMDLTKFGSIMMMLLYGVIIATVVNWLMGSQTLDYLISFAGVALFTGLTAYDVQKLKRIGMGVEQGTNDTAKLSIMGALTLFLDFLNLFLFLLRLLGNRK